MELVKRTDITKYAQRNTSPKMPIEQQFVYAFIDALMNSTSLQDLYEILKDEMQNGDGFVIFNSFHPKAKNVNKEPYRSIIAYSMLKKDLRLFELISSSMFTGKVFEYHGSELYTDTALYTDESPEKYTDAGIYTDMSEGLIQIGFQNWFSDSISPDGAGSEYQTLEELNDSIIDFDYIITLTKPARVTILSFYVPYCYLSGNSTNVYTVGIDPEYEEFSAPFGDEISMDILNGLTDNEIMELYQTVSMYDTSLQASRSIEFERTTQRTNDYILLSYDMKTQSSEDAIGKTFIWSRITISSNSSDKTYVQEKQFDINREHYQKFVPIMLRLKDHDPTGPCLALTIEHGTPTVGAMFYTGETV